MRVNVLTLFNRLNRVPYREAVFYNIFPLGNIAQRIFMPVFKINFNVVGFVDNQH